MSSVDSQVVVDLLESLQVGRPTSRYAKVFLSRVSTMMKRSRRLVVSGLNGSFRVQRFEIIKAVLTLQGKYGRQLALPVSTEYFVHGDTLIAVGEGVAYFIELNLKPLGLNHELLAEIDSEAEAREQQAFDARLVRLGKLKETAV